MIQAYYSRIPKYSTTFWSLERYLFKGSRPSVLLGGKIYSFVAINAVIPSNQCKRITINSYKHNTPQRFLLLLMIRPAIRVFFLLFNSTVLAMPLPPSSKAFVKTNDPLKSLCSRVVAGPGHVGIPGQGNDVGRQNLKVHRHKPEVQELKRNP